MDFASLLTHKSLFIPQSSYLDAAAACAGDHMCMMKMFGSQSEELWEKYTKDADGVFTHTSADLTINDKATASESPATSIDGFKKIISKIKNVKLESVPKHCAMVFRNYLTVTKKDRDRDIIDSKGVTLDPQMPLLWQHIPVQPIGKYLGLVEKNEHFVEVVSCILDINQLSSDAIKLVEAEALRISHGFKPIKFEALPDDPREQLRSGVHVKECLVVEESLVSCPANDGAVITAFSRSKLTHPMIKSWAKSLFDNRAPIVPGAEFPSACSCQGTKSMKKNKVKPPVDDEELDEEDIAEETDDEEEIEPTPTARKPRKKPVAKGGDGEELCPECGEKMSEGTCAKCSSAKPKSLQVFGVKMIQVDGKETIHADENTSLGTKYYATVEKSWEAYQQKIRASVRDKLVADGVLKKTSKDDDRYPQYDGYSYCEATFDNKCIVCVEGRQTKFYSLSWKPGPADEIVFEGKAKEVAVSATIKEKMLSGISTGRLLADIGVKESRVLSAANAAKLQAAIAVVQEVLGEHAETLEKRKLAKEGEKNPATSPVDDSPANQIVADPVVLGKSLAAICLTADVNMTKTLEQYRSLLDSAIVGLRTKKADADINAGLKLLGIG